MSSGLYSGVSGLALGVGLYKDVSGLWSGASGLDAGFDGPSLALNFLSGTLDPRITFTRASTATFVGSNGLIQSAAIDAPRFDYDPVTLAPRGLLVEEARTNPLLYSEQFDNAVWVLQRATITATATTAPDGTLTADRLVDNAVSGTHRVFQTASKATSALAYTGSVYLKAGTLGFATLRIAGTAEVTYTSVGINLATGELSALGTNGFTAASASVSNAGNGWWRVQLVGTTDITASISLLVGTATSLVSASSYTGDGNGSIFVWGAQLEAGAFATSYIPTVASTVARSPDVASMTGTNFSSWYNQSEGTFVATWTALGFTTTNMVFAVTNGGTTDVVQQFLNSATAARFTVRVAGVGQVALDATVNLAAVNKVANAYEVNDFAAVANGGVVATDTTGTIPTVNQMWIGSRSGTLVFNGHIQTFVYFNTRFPDTALQQATV